MSDSPADDADAESTRSSTAVRIVTGSRLHFGLLDTAAPFGGVGVIIDQPATEVVVTASGEFRCDDDDRARVSEIARRVADFAGETDLPRCQVTVRRRAPQHYGLGSGTQLALATAEGLCRSQRLAVEPIELATRLAARGERSAIGVHGYFVGGLIYEYADQPCPLNPLRRRVQLPSDWCVAIFRPSEGATNVSGDWEREQFACLEAATPDQVAGLQRVIVDEILPAAQQADLSTFGSAVHRYNRASGGLFASVQGGPYHGEAVANLVDRLIALGAQGVGQSSWGPGVFSWFESRAEAEEFAGRVPDTMSLITIAQPQNCSRELRIS